MHLAIPFNRRTLLTTLALATGSQAARSETQANLLVAGPMGGRLDRWAELLCGTIGRGLPSRLPLVRQNVGGLDGVTGANLFEARGEPDGNTALLVPGAAILSWLVGESRARFDPARWIPLWAGATSAVLVSRAVLQPGRTLRVAAAGPTGPELPALLALDLLGVNVVLSPVQDADAMLLQSAFLPSLLKASTAENMNPVMTFGLPGPNGVLGRDPLLPTIPTVVELAQERASPLMLAAIRAATIAAQWDESLVLPQLTPAASIANWRRACTPLLTDADMLSEAARFSTRLISPTVATSGMGQIAGDPAMLLTVRKWLATRYDWQPA